MSKIEHIHKILAELQLFYEEQFEPDGEGGHYCIDHRTERKLRRIRDMLVAMRVNL